MSENYPRRVETYRGVVIWFDPRRNKYYASQCEHSKWDEDIKVVKKWLDYWKNVRLNHIT